MTKSKFIVSVVKPDGVPKDAIRRHILDVLNANASLGSGSISKVAVNIVADPPQVDSPFKRSKVVRNPWRSTRE
jgi:hypothetical protein